jgi:hypothetical protein
VFFSGGLVWEVGYETNYFPLLIIVLYNTVARRDVAVTVLELLAIDN